MNLLNFKEKIHKYITESSFNTYISSRFKWDNYTETEPFLQAELGMCNEELDTRNIFSKQVVMFTLTTLATQDYTTMIYKFKEVMEYNKSFPVLKPLLTDALIKISYDYDLPQAVEDTTHYSHIFQYTFELQTNRS